MDQSAPEKIKFDFKALGIVLFGLVFWIFIGVPLFGPLLLWKVFVVIPLAKKFHPDLIPISRMDSLVVFNGSKSSPVANPCQVWKLRGSISLQKFREHFHECFLSSEHDQRQHENLLCYFVEYLGFLFKKRIPLEELDLSEHISEIFANELNLFYKLHSGDSVDLNISKGDANANNETRCESDRVSINVDSFIGKWMATCTYRKNKPQWEILLIHMDDGTTTVCFKIDHGLCDGYSFVHLVDKLSGSKSPYLFPSGVPLSFKKKVAIFIQAPYVAFWYLWGRILWDKGLFDPKPKSAPATFSGPPYKPEWFLSFASLDLDLVKAIRRKTNTHFVTVLMSVLSGAIRRFVLETTITEETQMDDEYEEDYLPNSIHMGHSLGWSNHPAMSTKSSTKLCNHLTMASYAVPVMEENPLERLLVCEEEFREYERQSGPEIFNYVVMRVMWILPGFIKRHLQQLDFGFMRFTCFFSSLILSPQPISLLGVPVKQLTLPLVLPSVTPSCSLFVVVTTQSGQLELSINASSEVFPSQTELDRFTRGLFPNELQKLGESVKVCD